MIKNSLSFVLLIIITNFGIAVSDDFTGHLYYSGEYSKLPGYISTSGLDSKSEEITEASSAAGVKMDWGPKWYQGFEIDVYSKANLFPVKMGTGPDTDIDMFYLAAAFGVPLSPQLSRMIYTITKYQAIGIVDGDVPAVKADGTLLNVGDEVTVGTKIELLVLGGDPSAKRKKKGGMKNITSFFGVGLARLTFYGGEEIWAEDGMRVDTLMLKDKTVYGIGVLIRMNVDYNPFYVNVIGELAGSSGQTMKTGYDLGVKFNIKKDIALDAYLGGYAILLNSPSHFVSYDSFFGYSLGLKLRYHW